MLCFSCSGRDRHFLIRESVFDVSEGVGCRQRTILAVFCIGGLDRGVAKAGAAVTQLWQRMVGGDDRWLGSISVWSGCKVADRWQEQSSLVNFGLYSVLMLWDLTWCGHIPGLISVKGWGCGHGKHSHVNTCGVVKDKASYPRAQQHWIMKAHQRPPDPW